MDAAISPSLFHQQPAPHALDVPAASHSTANSGTADHALEEEDFGYLVSRSRLHSRFSSKL
jgi:hypothetical protein